MAERVMPDGAIVRCSGPPTCEWCVEEGVAVVPDSRLAPVDIVDRIDELVNWQLNQDH
jgi:hypothetical protein